MLPVPWPFVKSSFHCIEVANLCQEVLDPLGSYMQVFTPGGGGVLPYRRLMGMCRWMGSHFHDWIDYNWFAFSRELLDWIAHFLIFWHKKVLHISDWPTNQNVCTVDEK